MVVVSYSGKEINGKLVYYGPGLSGKTTNLEYIYQSVPSTNRGKMVSMKTRTERTLFFDFLPVDLGELGGFKTRFLLYTVPGQVYYNATRKLVLRGVDAVIFVADSGQGKMDENIESLQNLRDNLKEYGLSLDEVPWVIQYNKRDLDEVYSIEELEKTLNPDGVPYYEAVATTGQGVFETFRGIAKHLLTKLSKEIKLGETKGSTDTPEPEIVQPAVPAAESPAEESAPEPVKPYSMKGRPSQGRASGPQKAVGAVPPPPVEASEPEMEPEMEPVKDAPSTDAPSTDAPAPPVEAEEPVAESVPAPRKLEPILPEPPAATEEGDEGSKRGFWGRIFRRGSEEEVRVVETPVVADEEPTRMAEVQIPAVAGSGDESPVFIEKRVQVPITLGPEEVVRGAKLRLVLEIEVQASRREDGSSSSEDTKVA